MKRYLLQERLPVGGQYNNSFEKSITAYLESLRMGTPAPISAVAGLLELQVEAAVKRSISQKRPILLEVEFPLSDSTKTISKSSLPDC